MLPTLPKMRWLFARQPAGGRPTRDGLIITARIPEGDEQPDVDDPRLHYHESENQVFPAPHLLLGFRVNLFSMPDRRSNNT